MSYDCENIWDTQPEQESQYDGPCRDTTDDFISLGGLSWVTLSGLEWVDK